MRCFVPSWKAMVVSTGIAASPRIDRLDDVAVLLVDDAAAHLAGAGQLVVVGVQLLVEQQEVAMRCAAGRVALTFSTSRRSSS